MDPIMHSIAKAFAILLLSLSLAAMTGCKGESGGSLGIEPLGNNYNDNNNGNNNNGTSNTTGSLTLSWDAPTANIDGSSAAVAGYILYYGTASGFYTAALDIGNVTTYTVSNLSIASGVYYFAVTAYDASGNESDFSNEISRSF